MTDDNNFGGGQEAGFGGDQGGPQDGGFAG